MNIKALKAIINSEFPDTIKEAEIISILADDEKVIPQLMKLLEEERRSKKILIRDMNLELSRAHVYIDELPEAKSKGNQTLNKNFVIDKISEFYVKYKSMVTHCFNRFN